MTQPGYGERVTGVHARASVPGVVSGEAGTAGLTRRRHFSALMLVGLLSTRTLAHLYAPRWYRLLSASTRTISAWIAAEFEAAWPLPSAAYAAGTTRAAAAPVARMNIRAFI
jgi:hypothetical protein